MQHKFNSVLCSPAGDEVSWPGKDERDSSNIG